MTKKHAKGNPGQGGAQPGAGRPRVVISEEDMAKAESYALENCQNGTIEGLMGWPNQFIMKRDDIAKRLRKKRQEHKLEIRQSQRKHVKNPVMAIFLGKNALGQADKQELSGKDGQPLLAPVINVMPKEGSKDG